LSGSLDRHVSTSHHARLRVTEAPLVTHFSRVFSGRGNYPTSAQNGAANDLIRGIRNILTRRGIDLRYGDVARNGGADQSTRQPNRATAAL
jgi:hypothetical protein